MIEVVFAGGSNSLMELTKRARSLKIIQAAKLGDCQKFRQLTHDFNVLANHRLVSLWDFVMPAAYQSLRSNCKRGMRLE
jgi:hypothetical protein